MGVARYTETERQVLVHFGKMLRKQRTLKGWTQADLGERVGERFQVIQKWECAATAPSLPQLCRISQALGILPHLLLPTEFFP